MKECRVTRIKKGFTAILTPSSDGCGNRCYQRQYIMAEPEKEYRLGPYPASQAEFDEGLPFDSFREVFGQLGCRTIEMERAYFHAVWHFAKMLN